MADIEHDLDGFFITQAELDEIARKKAARSKNKTAQPFPADCTMRVSTHRAPKEMTESRRTEIEKAIKRANDAYQAHVNAMRDLAHLGPFSTEEIRDLNWNDRSRALPYFNTQEIVTKYDVDGNITKQWVEIHGEPEPSDG